MYSYYVKCIHVCDIYSFIHISSHGCNMVASKTKCNKVVCATVHKFAYIKTIEPNNVVSSSIGFTCSSWNSVKRYDLVALSEIRVCNKVISQGRNCDTTLLQQGRNFCLLSYLNLYACLYIVHFAFEKESARFRNVRSRTTILHLHYRAPFHSAAYR